MEEAKNLWRKSFEKSPKDSVMRYLIFSYFIQHFLSVNTELSLSEIDGADQKILKALEKDESEELIYRFEAAFTRGMLLFRNQNADIDKYSKQLRSALALYEQMTPEYMSSLQWSMNSATRTPDQVTTLSVLQAHHWICKSNLEMAEDPAATQRVADGTSELNPFLENATAPSLRVRRIFSFAKHVPEVECQRIIGIVNFGIGKKCDECGAKRSTAMKRCGKCKLSAYCTRACQLKAWKTHKKVCRSAGVFVPGDIVEVSDTMTDMKVYSQHSIDGQSMVDGYPVTQDIIDEQFPNYCGNAGVRGSMAQVVGAFNPNETDRVFVSRFLGSTLISGEGKNVLSMKASDLRMKLPKELVALEWEADVSVHGAGRV